MMNNKATSPNGPELFPQPAHLKKGARVYTVSEITQDIKLILENTFHQVWVEGEVSGVSRIATGTIFFNLKDNSSLLKCIIFFSVAADIKFELKDGMQAVCSGRISVWEKDGRYQLYVQSIEPKGIGSLQLALEQLKARLEKEGLFSPKHKRAIPYLPSRIGVVTSLQGAAIKDILKVVDRRFKDVHIVINPARVQGEGAKEDIVRAIDECNVFNQKIPEAERIEVMIVGRGGGSIEDLWAFNEEIVARAIYNSKIPVISAVGHERDVTIADLVADLRAPTPSVAAELVIPKKEDLEEKVEAITENLKRSLLDMVFDLEASLDDWAHRLATSIEHILALNINEFEAAVKKLKLLNPVARIQQYQEKVAVLAKQMHVHVRHFIAIRESELHRAIEKLAALSPVNILARGYGITFQMPHGAILKDAANVSPGDTIKTRLHKGEIVSKVTEVN